MSLVATVFEYSDAIKNGRTLERIFNHADGEMRELEAEIALNDTGAEDGIVGEAIDVIQCMLDIIHQYNPKCTEADLQKIMIRKCKKWQRLYG